MTKNRINEEKLNRVCRLGCGKETCAFLAFNSQDGFYCAKSNPALATTINEELESGLSRAKGNNCDGEVY